MIKSCVALAAVIFAAVATPAPGHAQVFLASQPHPDFMIGPLFVVASVSPGVPHVTANLSWSLTAGPGTRQAHIGQELLLPPPAGGVGATAPRPPGPSPRRGGGR